MRKQTISMLLTLALCLSIMPVPSLAAKTDTGSSKRKGDGEIISVSRSARLLDNIDMLSRLVSVIDDDHNLWVSGGDAFYNPTRPDRIAWEIVALNSYIKVMENVSSTNFSLFNQYILTTDGILWKLNNIRDLLHGSVVKPEQIAERVLDNVEAVSVMPGYYDMVAAITFDGLLYTWGYNGTGQLGNGTTESTEEPQRIMEDVKAVSVGQGFTMAIQNDGSLWTWGSNGNGELGNGGYANINIDSSIQTIPKKIMNNVTAISAGRTFASALTNDGSLWMWGKGYSSDSEHSSIPVKIMDDVIAICAGWYQMAVITKDRCAWIWNVSEFGKYEKLDNNNVDLTSPVLILEDAYAVSTWDNNTVVLRTDGSVWHLGWMLEDSGFASRPMGKNYDSPTKVFDEIIVPNHLDNDICLIPITGVMVSPTILSLKVGESAPLTTTVLPSNASNKEVRWSSSDPSVATVNNGLVTAVGEGTATITATTVDGGFSARCTVNVARSFNEYLYRADYLLNLNNSAPRVMHGYMYEQVTPSEVLIQAGEEHGLAATLQIWKTVTGIGDAFGDPSSIADIPLEYKDVYFAIIANILQASVSYDAFGFEYTSDLKHVGEFVDSVNDILQTYGEFSSGASSAFRQVYDSLSGSTRDQYLQDISDSIKKIYQEHHTDLSELGGALDSITTSIELLETVNTAKEYFERVSTCYAIAVQCKKYQDVIEKAYSLSLSTENLYLQGALYDCKKMIESENKEILANALVGQSVYLGTKALQFAFKEVYWEGVKDYLKASHPGALILMAAYSGSKLITNALFKTDAIEKHFSSLKAMVEVEKLFFEVNRNLRNQYAKNHSVSSAIAFLDSYDYVYFSLNEDCNQATDYVEFIESVNTSLGWGDLLADQTRNSIKGIRVTYAEAFDRIKRAWIDSLEDSFPGSGLEEFYRKQYQDINYGILVTQVRAACPVDVYVYNQKGVLVASVVGKNVSCEDDSILIARLGDEKIIRFYGDEEYRIEYVGTDSGTMDISISEYDSNEDVVRTTNFDDVPLKTGKKYDLTVDETIIAQKEYQLNDKTTNDKVSYDYDSLLSTDHYSVTVEAGLLLQNGEVLLDGNVKAGERLGLSAVIPEGYRFVRWESNYNSLVFSDKTSRYSSFVMPKKDVVITAVLEKSSQSKIFVDVAAGAYYASAVQWAVENGITSGTGATTFSPDATCTRAQMVTFLWRTAGSPVVQRTNPFVDVRSDAYYYNAVLWAVKNGITAGTSAARFSPEDTVTRDQAVTFLYRFAGSPDVSGGNAFRDVPGDAYYAPAVQWAVSKQVTNGTDATTFSPGAPCTRAQTVTFLYRMQRLGVETTSAEGQSADDGKYGKITIGGHTVYIEFRDT